MKEKQRFYSQPHAWKYKNMPALDTRTFNIRGLEEWCTEVVPLVVQTPFIKFWKQKYVHHFFLWFKKHSSKPNRLSHKGVCLISILTFFFYAVKNVKNAKNVNNYQLAHCRALVRDLMHALHFGLTGFPSSSNEYWPPKEVS